LSTSAEIQVLQRLSHSPASVWELLDSQDSSLGEFYALLEQLKARGLVEVRGGRVSLTPRGEEHVRKLGVRYFDFRCASCGGRGYSIPEDLEELAEEFFRIAERRPLPVEEYDQGYIAPVDVLRRVGFIYERGDLTSREVLVIGDDDLLSIAAALTAAPRRVVAIDIDERLVSFINRVSEEHGLRLEAMTYDVQEPLEESLRRGFDVFVSDPVETLEGIKLFLSRGAAALRGAGSAAYFGLTTLEASRRKWYRIQRMLHDMGFVVTDIRRRFSVYPCEDTNFFRYQEKLRIVRKLGVPCDHHWFRSALYRVEAVAVPEPLVADRVELGEKFYHDEECWATPE